MRASPRSLRLFLLVVLFTHLPTSESFAPNDLTKASFAIRHKTTLLQEQKDDGGNNPLSFLFNPYESKIPKEIEKEIYEAEGNTAAAKDRSSRIALYAGIALVGIGLAFFNGFLSELRASESPDGAVFDIADSPFAWVNGNFLFQFLFMNKLGGLLFLLSGAGAGLLAEAELDTRRLNAEKIYEELVRRREKKERGGDSRPSQRKKKRRRGTKEAKRMVALAEVIDEAAADTQRETKDEISTEQTPKEAKAAAEEPQKETKQEGGILDSIKGFYDDADKMAASQALLLNKKLEDAGVLEKITDESGMRVIGKEEAAKLTTDAEASENPKKKRKKKKSKD